MNVSVFVSALSRLGFSDEFILDRLSPLMGKIPDKMQIPRVKITLGDLLKILGQQLGLSLSSGFTHKRFLNWVQNECLSWCETRYIEIEQCSNNQELLAVYYRFEPMALKTFKMLIFFANLLLLQLIRLKASLVKVLNPADLEIMLSGLGGEQQLQSMGPLLAISAMIKGEITRQEFSRRYGHRGPLEAELAMPRSGEDPDWIDKLVAQWQDSNPEDLLARQQQKRDRIWTSLDQASPRKSRNLRKLFSAAAQQAQNREHVRSELIRQSWIIRRWVEKIVEVNNLEADLYFLNKSEILDFLAGNTGVLARIEARKETFAAYSSLPPLPNIISGRFDPFQWSKDPHRRTDYFDAHHSFEANNEDLIRGFPGSAGVVEGTVRLLESHEQMDEFLAGEILVTSYTNVGWTPLFPRAAAIVTDIGAPLSHAAIVARELGIPAVVGTGSATMKLKSGDRVKVNGSEGIVELLQPIDNPDFFKGREVHE
jgi:pyruvate,water dikinase